MNKQIKGYMLVDKKVYRQAIFSINSLSTQRCIVRYVKQYFGLSTYKHVTSEYFGADGNTYIHCNFKGKNIALMIEPIDDDDDEHQ